MKKPWILLVVAGMLATASLPAWAQQANAVAQSAAGASSLSQSGGNVFNFGGSKIPQNTPDAIAPGLTAGASRCALSSSIGIGAMGFGISGGSAYPYDECNQQVWMELVGKLMEVRLRIATNPDPGLIQYEQWMRGIVCNGNPTIRADAPPGVCAPAPVVASAPQPSYAVYGGAQAGAGGYAAAEASPTAGRADYVEQRSPYPAQAATTAVYGAASVAARAPAGPMQQVYIPAYVPSDTIERPAWCETVAPSEVSRFRECSY